METYLARLKSLAALDPKQTVFNQPLQGQWKTFSREQVVQEVLQVASAIKALNLPTGSSIAILSKNCAHWIIADLAIFQSGHISVPIFPTFQPHTLKAVIEHSEAKVIFVGKLDNWNELKGSISSDCKLISFPDYPQDKCLSWAEFLSAGQEQVTWRDRPESDVATIIYSSGTTGTPKGVVHNFKSVNFAAAYANKQLSYTESDHFISYLPLCHVVERTLTEFAGLYSGAPVSFVDSPQSFLKDLTHIKPTMFIAVPRIWAKLQSGILEKLPSGKLKWLVRIPVLNSIIRRKIRAALGLDRARWIFTGGSPISIHLLDWFKSVGIEIREGYGMTENLGYAHFAIFDKWKPGNVGPSLEGVTTRIGKDSEIQIKSKTSMVGYYKDHAETDKSFENGFFKTGDQGKFDADGNLQLTGRIKELFKTTKGKYVAPAPIEEKLSENESIENSCVMGNGFASAVAILQLKTAAKNQDRAELTARLEETLHSVNSEVEHHEKLAHLFCSFEPWTPENGFLTPTLKVKRAFLEKHFIKKIEPLLGKSELVHFLDGM